MNRDTLVRWLDEFLDASACPDYGPNGLQVEGRPEIRHIVCGVTASLQLIEIAVALNADAILVHHGILWGGGPPTITGAFGRRVRTLVRADLNLLAYHLPLDRHLEVGNAASLASRLGLTDLQPFGLHKGTTIGISGVPTEPDIDSLLARVEAVAGRSPTAFPYGPRAIRRVGIITGGADRDVSQAVTAGFDAYLTGEVSEPSLHTAREEGIHYIAAGHHATERYGVQALCARLADVHGLTWEYVEVDNPA